ncbi:RNA-directed DNA polymerase, eukaryota, reverse transcriptase zinc-binding domain protein [Tanacetum coccineum]|uniref:RNA-directed DNA polymerase, eukaryota, reverse transcriptase zinc-binding domain protein n=1 Tax=Tanacetum coccineum TaxID=301880 RepID=A0ABQ5C284_9ASTR
MSKTRSSKRVTRIPLKFGDSICTFTSKHNKHRINDLVENEKNRIDNGNECSNEGESCEEENGENGEQGKEVNSGQGMDGWGKNMNGNNECAKSCQGNVSVSEPLIDITTNIGNDNIPDNNIHVNNHTNRSESKIKFESYAKVVNSGSTELSKELVYIPTGTNDNGDEVVIFEEELVEEGSKLKYNLRRMWERHGLAEIIAEGNDLRIFKFKSAEGMNYVLDQSPWMVNGKPLVVQKWDPDVCFEKSEPSGYARILVEIEAKKGIQDQIEIVYKDAMNYTKKTKFVKAEYNWKPNLCVHCEVFGHSDKTCKIQMKNDEGNLHGKNQRASDGGIKDGRNELFTEVRRKQKSYNNNAGPSTSNFQNQRRVIEAPSLEKVWRVNNDTMESLKKSANKYVVLSTEEEEVENICYDNRSIVDWYILKKQKPKVEEMVNWTYEMKQYFKYKWEALNRNDIDSEDENEVMEVNDPAIVNLIAEEIQGGINNELKQKEAVNLIREEKVQFCAFIETHLKIKTIDKVGRKVFGNWDWSSNIQHSPTCCRIMFGWNPNLEHAVGMSHRNIDMQEFYETVNTLEVKDICSSGFQFTWTKSLKNPNCVVLKKLDRILVNDEFMKQHQKAHGIFLPYGISDHSPAVLTIHDGYCQKSKAFGFSNFVANKDKFIDIVKDGWRDDVPGCHMFRLVRKLKNLKKPLRKLSWNQGNVHDRVNILKDELKKCQKAVDKNPFDKDVKIKAAQVLGDYMEAKQFVLHFKNFLGESKAVRSTEDNIFTNKISAEDADMMIREVSSKEIKDAIFDIDSNKASGPDGYSSEFFKKAWEVVGDDVCLAISTPNKVSEFRHIACCNVMYKCISKILTNRIKHGLSKVVNINQSAFIPGRHIQDNILLAQELMRGYNRKNGHKRCAMQIDIQKAYDTVSWRFLEDILRKFGFPNMMFKWIMACITSSTFSICLNGEIHGYFKGGRGLRQRDPISPYLFTLVMEVFNLIMCKNINDSPDYGYHFGCKDLKLSHLCFADDLLVICKGNKESMEVVKKSLEEFSEVSGLNPNLGKSIIFFGSIKEREKLDLLEILPFKCGKLPVRYLGVTLLAKRLSVMDCKVLTEKVEERINCWRNKHLSYAGRIQLLASVMSSMQIYWASVHLLPNSVIKDLDKLFKKFLWNSGDSAQGKARVAWKIVCRPKEHGGLGLKPLKQWNETLLIRHFWKIIENKDSLWAKWVNVVRLKGKSIWDVVADKSDSWGWKTMLKTRDTVRKHVWYKVGNGKSTSVLYDKWCEYGPLSDFISKRDIYEARIKDNVVITDMMDGDRWKWPVEWLTKFPVLRSIAPPKLQSGKEDEILWINNQSQRVQFSTSQAWETLKEELPVVHWRHVVWYSQLIPRHAFILWLAIQGKLLTQDRMEKWQNVADLKCALCNQCADSHDHLFFKGVWISEFSNEELDWDHNTANSCFLPPYDVDVVGYEFCSQVLVLQRALYLGNKNLSPVLILLSQWMGIIEQCAVKGNVAKRDCVPEQLLSKVYLLLLVWISVRTRVLPLSW